MAHINPPPGVRPQTFLMVFISFGEVSTLLHFYSSFFVFLLVTQRSLLAQLLLHIVVPISLLLGGWLMG